MYYKYVLQDEIYTIYNPLFMALNFFNHQSNNEDMFATNNVVTRKLDISRMRSYTFLLWYLSHKISWDDDEIHNEIQSTQQYPSTKKIAIVKTSIAMD